MFSVARGNGLLGAAGSDEMATAREERIDAAAAPADGYDVGAAFGEHAIEWWVFDGTRLVPAAPEQAALLTRVHDALPGQARPRASIWRGVWHHLLPIRRQGKFGRS